MNYVKSFNLFGLEARQITCITGEGAPTTSTEGAVGCFYMDTSSENGDIYKCTNAASGVFTWILVEGGKGVITNLAQTVGDDPDAVMSQKAVTAEFDVVKGLIYQNPCDHIVWEIGTIQSDTGKNEVLTTTIRTNDIPIRNYVIIPDTDVMVRGVWFYDKNGSYIERTLTTEARIVNVQDLAPENAESFRLVARYYVLSDITDLDDLTSKIHIQIPCSGVVKELQENLVDENIPWKFASNASIQYNTGEELASGTYKSTDYVYVGCYKNITYKRTCITLAGNTKVGMAFYDKNRLYISGVLTVLNSQTLRYVDHKVNVPNDAVYARFSYFNDASYGEFDIRGDIDNVADFVRGTPTEIDKLTLESNKYVHVIPDNVGVLNAIKRARQITDLKWTPAVDIPRVSNVTGDEGSVQYHSDVFKKDHTYVGVPYSATETSAPSQFGYTRMHIGFEVPLETFVTAACNPNSVVSKQSEINSYNTGCVYGLTCTSFLSYVYGFSTYYDTGSIQNVSGIDWLGEVVNGDTRFDIDGLKLCDMLLYRGHHGVLVTDIVKDSNDNVILVEISEVGLSGKYTLDTTGSQYGGVARRKLWGVEDFYEYFANFTVYRYSGLNSVTYTPNKYVPIEKDGVLADDCYLPCIPYMGDKFNYKYGHIHDSSLLTQVGLFTHIRVEKDGFVFNANGTDDFYEISADGITEIGFSEIGNYKATPCKLSNDTWIYGKSCSWSVKA